jgi:hypothetical protein
MWLLRPILQPWRRGDADRNGLLFMMGSVRNLRDKGPFHDFSAPVTMTTTGRTGGQSMSETL